VQYECQTGSLHGGNKGAARVVTVASQAPKDTRQQHAEGRDEKCQAHNTGLAEGVDPLAVSVLDDVPVSAQTVVGESERAAPVPSNGCNLAP